MQEDFENYAHFELDMAKRLLKIEPPLINGLMDTAHLPGKYAGKMVEHLQLVMQTDLKPGTASILTH